MARLPPVRLALWLVSAAAALSDGPYLVLDATSDWELVFKYPTDACPNINPRTGLPGDVPDSMPVAWFNRGANRSSLIFATSQGVHASVAHGPTLDGLSRDCDRVVFNSTFSHEPETFANNQWIQSVRLFPNGSAYALVHNEFKGELYNNPDFCSCLSNRTHPNASCANHCELWSTGLAVSKDAGNTFELVHEPPKHLVAALPWRFRKDQKLAGYGAVSTLLRGSDGAYYGLINIAGSSQEEGGVAPGNCPIRSADLGNPSAYRARGASGAFDVKWADPYSSAPQPGQGACATVEVTGTSPLAAHVCLRRMVGGSAASPRFVAVGDAARAVRYAFSYEPDVERALFNWTGAGQIELDLDRWEGPEGRVLYPVLLDHGAPSMGAATGDPVLAEDGDNFALTSMQSDSLYLYVVISGRNIVRRRVLMSNSPPPPPPPPLPPLPRDCVRVRLSGAGNATANGVYSRTNETSSDGAPVFRMEGVNALEMYVFNGSSGVAEWHLGRMNVQGSVLYANQNEPLYPTPPPDGWRLSSSNPHIGQSAPAPERVTCISE